jgi:guanylate kinase
MRARGDSEEHIAQRLEAADAEEQIGRELADSVIINADLDHAVGAVESVIADFRQQRSEL